MNKAYESILNEVKEALAEEKDFDERLRLIVKILKKGVEKYTWVGVYLKKGAELHLHNYIGRPTEHMLIPIDKGICGAAVQQGKTLIIEDVNEDPRYLACSIETKSEIVVPIYKGKEIIGEIDIDSDYKNAFNEEDKELLEEIAKMI